MADLPQFAVLGANGFVGHRLVEWLTLLNVACVRPLVRSFAGLARLARFELDARVVDATNQEALAENLRGCDALFHCVVGDRATIVKSVEACYRACVKAEVHRFVYLSSAVVHGNIPEPGTTDTTDLLDLQPFEYNVSKVMAERHLREVYARGECEVVTLRPCIVYGPRSKWWTAQIAEDMLKGRAYLLDGGTGICNTVYVDNLMEALLMAALEGPQVAFQEYLITDGERVTWWDLYNSIAEALGIGLDRVHMLEGAPLWMAAALKEPEMIAQATGKPVPAANKGLFQTIKKAAAKVLPLGRSNGAPAPAAPPALEPKDEDPSVPQPDWETASLQLCQVQFPIDKARKELNYNPSIKFADAARLTGEWLRFAYGIS